MEQERTTPTELIKARAAIPTTPQVWDRSRLYYTPREPMISYVRRTKEYKTVVKWGQLKLILSEIQALTTFWDPAQVPNLTVVYAGAAPGHHFTLLSEMFPTVEWHLYDPSPFHGVEQGGKIHLYNQYFTDGDATRWSGRNDVFFFSDIRTVSHLTTTGEGVEKGISGDMEMQQRWVQIMDPYQAHLKLRMPYLETGQMANINYLAGHIMFQSFNGPTSTETRLVPVRDESGRYYQAKYDLREYEDRLFYHNAVIRERCIYDIGPYPTDEDLGRNFDAAHLLTVISDYLSFVGDVGGDRSKRALALSRLVRMRLSRYRTVPVTLKSLREDLLKAG